MNYDYFEDSQIIKDGSWRQTTELLIFDELHKMPGWKNYLKGLYDTKPENLKILVTGSARFDMFRQFRIAPYSKNIARSILKEPKIYFFDNGLVVGDDGAKFENFAALSLLKHACGKIDYEGESFELKYLRTKDGREVDFCLVNNNQIVEAIEAKISDGNVSDNLAYFCEKYNLKGVQIVKELKRERTIGRIDVLKADSYLKKLFL